MWELDHKEGWMQKNQCFWTVVLEKTLESPWTASISSHSILKEINPEYSLEGLMPKLKLQCFGYLMWRADPLGKKPWCWERLSAEGEGDDRGWDGWMASLTQWLEFELVPGVSDGQRSLACCSSWGRKESDRTEWLNWTELNWTSFWLKP